MLNETICDDDFYGSNVVTILWQFEIYNTFPVRAVALKNLYLDGILLQFDGSPQRPSSTSNITLFSCTFFSSHETNRIKFNSNPELTALHSAAWNLIDKVDA